MTADLISTAGKVIGAVVSLPLAVACFKGARFFGRMEQTVDHLGQAVKTLTDTLTEFTGDVHDDLSDLGERMAVAETKLDITPPQRVGRYDRRHHAPRNPE